MKSATVDCEPDIDDETTDTDTEEDEETQVKEVGMLIQSNCSEATKANVGISEKLHSVISQSEKSRNLWEKFCAIPP